MLNRFLIAVDMQNDFISGALGTAQAEGILLHAVKKIKDFDGTVFFTQDTHDEEYLLSQEGKNLPVKHCIYETDGWQIAKPIREIQENRGFEVFRKNTFGSVALAQRLSELHRTEPISSVELIGLCTDICVISNALLIKAFLPEIPIYVDALCCAGVTPEAHEAALKTMKSCQIHILNWGEKENEA